MKILFADRALESETGIFSILNKKKASLLQSGKEVFDMSIGTPDFPPAPHIIEAMTKACMNTENYKYAVSDLPELTGAVMGHYQRRFGVVLEENEIMSVYGSQEGIAHIAFVTCNPGDVVLVPDPGYPIFKDGPLLAGAKLHTYPLYRENGFIPDLKSIPEEIARQARVIVVSYPMNPVGVTAPDGFYEELIEFASKYDILVVHDNAYSDIVFQGKEGKSFLAYKGAKEVGIEFYSLSKSYNLTGARISFAIGNPKVVERFRQLRSKIDYGIFLPVQYAAIAAMTGGQSRVKEQCKSYERRGKKLCQGFRKMGWNVPDPQGTMFVWAPIPEKFSSSVEFCDELMDKGGVICTPGNSFGKLGEGYVRFALVMDEERIEKALAAIQDCNVLG